RHALIASFCRRSARGHGGGEDRRRGRFDIPRVGGEVGGHDLLGAFPVVLLSGLAPEFPVERAGSDNRTMASLPSFLAFLGLASQTLGDVSARALAAMASVIVQVHIRTLLSGLRAFCLRQPSHFIAGFCRFFAANARNLLSTNVSYR